MSPLPSPEDIAVREPEESPYAQRIRAHHVVRTHERVWEISLGLSQSTQP